MKNKWVCWCNLNAEQDELEKIFDGMNISVRGATPNEEKPKLEKEWRTTDIPIMISKPKVFGLGLNWQVANKAIFIGLSDSWEQFYQATRRIWRFGQTEEVDIHIVIEEREGKVLDNIKRKDKQARLMVESMIKHMKDLTKKELGQTKRTFVDYKPEVKMELPEWI